MHNAVQYLASVSSAVSSSATSSSTPSILAKKVTCRLTEKQEQLESLRALKAEILGSNPLTGFHACPEWSGSIDCPPPSERNPLGGRPRQHEFMADPHEVIATNAGNRFGKTTAMVVWSIIQHCPDELLPDRLRVFKRPRAERVQGQPV